jgi:hypothetical protein
MGPAVLITLGVLFLIDQYSMWSIGRTWPILLIVIGIVLLARRNASPEGHVDVSQLGPGAPPPGPPTPGGGGQAPSDGQQVNHG